MRILVAIALLPLMLITGCHMSSNGDALTRFHDDGRAKPIVALLPVIDNTGSDFPWDLSEELSYSIYAKVAKQGSFWIDNFSTNARLGAMIPRNIDLFQRDLSWLPPSFSKYEFVALVELIEHDIHPKQSSSTLISKITPSCELDMALRLRVIDMRHGKPKTILQEVITQSNLIPKQEALTEQSPERWKQKTYVVSPLGFSHLQLAKEVVQRIEDYILLAKSN